MRDIDADAVYRWRALDGHSLEVLRMRVGDQGCHARSWLIDAGDSPFAAEVAWVLDPAWRTRSVTVHLNAATVGTLEIERAGETSWRVDGVPRPDLDGCAEVDLSATPFCNTLAMRRFGPPPGGPGELTALYVVFPQLTCEPSRQRYERLGPRTFRYIDLGAQKGFEARLTVDSEGLIREYEGLFQRIEPTKPSSSIDFR
jgi:uncharacterized protein